MKKFIILSLAIASLASCRKDVEEDQIVANSKQAFSYTTTGDATVAIRALPKLAGATFELYTADPEEGGKLLGKGMIDESGEYTSSFLLADAQESIFLKSTYIGLPGEITIPVSNGRAIHDYTAAISGGSGKRGSSSTASTPSPVVLGNNVYAYMGAFDNTGLPSYLTTINDQVDQSLLADINASLPEGSKVPIASPQFIPSGNASDLLLKDSADVWVTFVHEGAGHKNGLGFYVYDTINPPSSVSQIDSIFTIFPNTSFAGSGGSLVSGHKVHLGSFGAGKGIGWVLFQNAFKNSLVDFTETKFFSNPSFNPEPNATDRQHIAMLYHPTRDLVLIGFEDIERHYPNCDQDFNDAIFYVSSNPIEAIQKGNIPSMNTTSNTTNDTDNDGVLNTSDDYPNDPTRAFDIYTPYQGGFSSIAFEDLWPSRGDYDFNDLVMSINYKNITNTQNMVVELEYKMFVRNIGASFHNGFGFSLPIPASQIQNVTGVNLTKGLISTESNGLESGHNNAVIIVFDDAFDNRNDTITLTITLNAPYSLSQLNQDGTNPFIFVDGERGREVHLVGQEPTNKVNASYFGQNDDNSDPSANRYYIGVDADPWAIEIHDSYAPPVEKIDIRTAYTKFTPWVESQGVSFSDWYQDKSGYRINSKLQ